MRLFLIVVLLLANSTRVLADAARRAKPVVLVYNGPGACKGCGETLGDLIEELGYKVVYVKPKDLTQKNFARAVMYVQPGGTDRVQDTLEKLNAPEIKNLREFVAHGGKYLGVCAGAYLAATKVNDGGKRRDGYGFIKAFSTDKLISHRARLISIYWQPYGAGPKSKIKAYFQDGPKFIMDPDAEPIKVWASYAHNADPAAFTSYYGNGKVGLIGPHLEADQSWFDDDKVHAHHNFHADLAKEFIKGLLKDEGSNTTPKAATSTYTAP